jgi:hypothetical protein
MDDDFYKKKLFREIAHRYLGIETLEVRNRDRLDFHDVGVVGVQKALEAAYQAGVKKGSEHENCPGCNPAKEHGKDPLCDAHYSEFLGTHAGSRGADD